jgi:hypothetical protein
MMFTNKLAKLLEKQRKRQIAALLAVCTPQEREEILAGQAMRRWAADPERSEADDGHPARK